MHVSRRIDYPDPSTVYHFTTINAMLDRLKPGIFATTQAQRYVSKKMVLKNPTITVDR
jgi:hypothetical protein